MDRELLVVELTKSCPTFYHHINVNRSLSFTSSKIRESKPKCFRAQKVTQVLKLSLTKTEHALPVNNLTSLIAVKN